MTSEAVILVHGHGAHPVLLEPLRRALERAGFRAVNWRYGSLRGSIETHAARLAAKATELDDDAGVARLHFVGHSMGAIVVRRALAMTRPRKLGRVVLLAPPNRGARLADLGQKFFGPRLTAATELGSHPESYVNRLAPTADLDCGVIAASWDHVVSLASTHLPGERDHLVLRSLHTLPLHHRVPAQVVHFPPPRPFPAPLSIARFCWDACSTTSSPSRRWHAAAPQEEVEALHREILLAIPASGLLNSSYVYSNR